MLKRMRSFLVLVMLFIAVTMSAQVTTATMSGKVTAQDEPIIGATVVAVHEPSGTRYGTVTNVSGQFNLQGMRTGGGAFFVVDELFGGLAGARGVLHEAQAVDLIPRSRPA